MFVTIVHMIQPDVISVIRHNSEAMIHMGLSLLTVALESGSHHIGTFPSLMNFVKDDLCKNLFWVGRPTKVLNYFYFILAHSNTLPSRYARTIKKSSFKKKSSWCVITTF